MMLVWEYHRIRVDQGTGDPDWRSPHVGGIRFDRLEQLGNDGWELIGVFEEFFYFKRAKVAVGIVAS